MSDREQHDLAELAELATRPDIRLVVTDLDGTLLDDAREIHDEFWPLADELFARGIAFCPASGRHFYSLREKFAPIAEEVTFIASNGAHVVTGGETVLADCLAPDVAAGVVERVRDLTGAWAVLCGARSAYIESTEDRFVSWIRPHYPALTFVGDLTQVDDDVLSVGIFDTRVAEEHSLPALADLASGTRLMATDPHWVDVVSPTADKGRAVRRVQEILGVSPDQTMVFGDYLNDLEMMATATYSFAMANAHPLLKERATWTAPTNSANGVVRTVWTMLGEAAADRATPAP